MPSRADQIREEIDKLDNDISTTKDSSSVKPKDEFELMNDWHKLERFLYHEANMHQQLSKTGYLNKGWVKKKL